MDDIDKFVSDPPKLGVSLCLRGRPFSGGYATDNSPYGRLCALDPAVTWEKVPESGLWGWHFTGAATSNINCGAIYNAAAKLWVSFWFKFDSTYSAAAANDMFIFGKMQDGDNVLQVYFSQATGRLLFRLDILVANIFTVEAQSASGVFIQSWEGGQWYHAFASISDVNGARLRIDNGYVVTDPAVTPAPSTGDFVFGDRDDPGGGTGFVGCIANFQSGVNDLTQWEEWKFYEDDRKYFGKW